MGNFVLYGIVDDRGNVVRDPARLQAQILNGRGATKPTDFARLDALFAETKRLMASKRSQKPAVAAAAQLVAEEPPPPRLVATARYGGIWRQHTEGETNARRHYRYL